MRLQSDYVRSSESNLKCQAQKRYYKKFYSIFFVPVSDATSRKIFMVYVTNSSILIRIYIPHNYCINALHLVLIIS